MENTHTHIYIYIYRERERESLPHAITMATPRVIPVYVKNTPPEKNTLASKTPNQGAGERLLLLDCRARGRAKGVFISDTCSNVYEL